MPGIYTPTGPDSAVLWMADKLVDSGDVNYGDDGEVLLDTPVEVDCRWQEVREEITDTQGNTVEISAKVAVDREVRRHSIMRRGTLAELPASPNNLFQVIIYNEAKNIKGYATRRTVGLVRYGDTLPSLA